MMLQCSWKASLRRMLVCSVLLVLDVAWLFRSKHEDVGSGGGGGDGRAVAQRPLPACSLPTTAWGRDPRRQVPDPRSRTAERASDSTAAAPQPCVRREKHPATARLAATGLQWSAPTAARRRGWGGRGLGGAAESSAREPGATRALADEPPLPPISIEKS